MFSISVHRNFLSLNVLSEYLREAIWDKRQGLLKIHNFCFTIMHLFMHCCCSETFCTKKERHTSTTIIAIYGIMRVLSVPNIERTNVSIDWGNETASLEWIAYSIKDILEVFRGLENSWPRYFGVEGTIGNIDRDIDG